MANSSPHQPVFRKDRVEASRERLKAAIEKELDVVRPAIAAQFRATMDIYEIHEALGQAVVRQCLVEGWDNIWIEGWAYVCADGWAEAWINGWIEGLHLEEYREVSESHLRDKST